jgi:2-polyprenyl-3-methyl-5-hydroxy-6-metoxy-1,4-benzoquinol methylase
MLNTIVHNYQVVADIPPTDHVFSGSSAASKDILKFAFSDNRPARTVLDIGFGIGGLAKMVKTDPALQHWQVDGIDGFDETCRNVELFSKGWYRHVWHGLAQDIPLDALRQYDALCLFDVIEHLDAPTAKQLLKTLLEALGPDSRLVISTPLWFYPQDHNRDGDLEEHLIGVPAQAMTGLQPLLYAISPDFLIGNFVLGRESLPHIDNFVATTDRGFSIVQGRAQVAALGLKADNSLQRWSAAKTDVEPTLDVMKQTPAHTAVNMDVLALIPSAARRIVEVGCMHGALAAAHRAVQPDTHYFGIDIDADYAAAAAVHCSQTMAANIETMDDAAFQSLFPSDCWIFADCLEHLRDPWRVLARVRQQISPAGSLLVCMPNAQHWSLQWRMVSGQFRYEDSGLLDRTHLRWFTRITMLEMFEKTGWRVEQGLSRNLNAPQQPMVLDAIRAFATATGIDPDMAEQDATAFQYVFKLLPAD